MYMCVCVWMCVKLRLLQHTLKDSNVSLISLRSSFVNTNPTLPLTYGRILTYQREQQATQQQLKASCSPSAPEYC